MNKQSFMTTKQVAEDAVNGKPFLLSVSGASPSFEKDSFISTHKTMQETKSARSVWEKKNPGEIGYASRSADVPEIRDAIMKLLDGKTASSKVMIAQELVKVAKELVAGAVTPKVIEKIKALTEDNLHTEAGILLAETVNAKQDEKTLNAILVLNKAMGYLPREVIEFRDIIVANIRLAQKSKMSQEDFDALYQAF
jgi:hypothetical protein